MSQHDRHKEKRVEPHRSIDDVSIRQLHLHVLPGFPNVVARNPENPAHERDGEGLHHSSGHQENDHAQEEAERAEPDHAKSESRGMERQHRHGWVWQDAQSVIDVGCQSDTRPGAQDLGGVATRGAPGVQREGEEAQSQVERDDEKRGVRMGLVKRVNGVQSGSKDQEDQQAEQETGNDILKI